MNVIPYAFPRSAYSTCRLKVLTSGCSQISFSMKNSLGYLSKSKGQPVEG